MVTAHVASVRSDDTSNPLGQLAPVALDSPNSELRCLIKLCKMTVNMQAGIHRDRQHIGEYIHAIIMQNGCLGHEICRCKVWLKDCQKHSRVAARTGDATSSPVVGVHR